VEPVSAKIFGLKWQPVMILESLYSATLRRVFFAESGSRARGKRFEKNVSKWKGRSCGRFGLQVGRHGQLGRLVENVRCRRPAKSRFSFFKNNCRKKP
jgi:hypothetical protein